MISSFHAYISALDRPFQRINKQFKPLGGQVNGFPTPMLLPVSVGTVAFVAPGAPVVPSRTDVNALGQIDSSRVQRLARSAGGRGIWPNNGMLSAAMLIDRLSHMSGLDVTIAGEQTTNLPTAPLTRYTDGVGVKVAVTPYSLLAGGPAEVTVRYTNHLGVSGRISQAVQVSVSGLTTNYLHISMPLQAGDLGVRSVQGVTLAGTPLTSGNPLGVTLYRPLGFLTSCYGVGGSVTDGLLSGFLPVVLPGACLQIFSMSASSPALSEIPMTHTFIEDDA